MRMSGKKIIRTLLDLSTRLGRTGLTQSQTDDEPPLRAELFSRDQMKRHAMALADSNKLSLGRPSPRLLTRLAENEGALIGTRNLLAEAVKAKRRIVPAGEWLLDNFYLIEEQIRTTRRHLPAGYSRELPRLQNGASAGLPRVYDIALEIISHGDGRVDSESLSSFVAAYQTVTDLKLGELWAIPIMLRLALIENLRRVAGRIFLGRIERNRADIWADQMIEIAEKDPKSLILVIADMARSNPPMVGSFIAEFVRRLQGRSPALALPLTWIENRLSESGLTIEQLVQAENRQQAADQVSMSNSIGSLRFLGAMDWREFIETMSVVEQTLRKDPGGVYGMMDFATRDRYRHIVERIAKRSRKSENWVALKAIQLAREGAGRQDSDERAAHVGFYLIDKGLPQLEREAEIYRSPAEALRKWIGRTPLFLYLFMILLITTAFTATLLMNGQAGGFSGWNLALLGIPLLLCMSHPAVALVNWLTTLTAEPHLLPRMDFSRGIPSESRTLVVIPTMLKSAQNIDDLVEGLEVRFLANRDENLLFALATDLLDASEETIPEDEPLLRLAQERIEELNKKYSDSKNDIFYLFHRSRRWNELEKLWMGYERKRGKLADLNSFLLSGADNARNSFSLIVGHTALLSNVKYVITLDTDTQLPRDSAWQFVGAMAHPLNRARYDDDKERVAEGYCILQPRMAMSMQGRHRSRYAQLFGSEPGIDPYTRAVSDIYQDLFHEGSFIGKGIYDVDMFERSLKNRFPENRILSHDLVEGCYARAGLLSDVQLYEEYPSSYNADMSRRHRWIRGDWQIARWLLPLVPGPGKSRRKNPLSGLSRWKIFDNLRRSIVPAALTLLMFLGWTAMSPDWLWTLAAIGTLLIAPLMASFLDLFNKPEDMALHQHLATTLRSAVKHLAQAAFTIACLPYEAFFSLDAIVRAVWRMGVTHKRLLEWTPASDPECHHRTDLAGSYRTMWIAPLIATFTLIYLALSRPTAITVAGPVLGLWFFSPAIAWWISKPLVRTGAKLTVDQTLFLHKLSRKTWAFFDDFVGPEDHWLPPDNCQEHSAPVIAHRTSPTNMGFALLANLSAYDFGYISSGQLIERTDKAFHTMETLERHQGHFYNWYDTQSLKPLEPAYISTVDSGNLAGHLLILRQGLLELPDQKILGSRWIEGLRDTLGILSDMAGGTGGDMSSRLAQLQNILASESDSRPTNLVTTQRHLARLTSSAAIVVESLDDDPEISESDVKYWAIALSRQCQDILDDLSFFTPWSLSSAAPNSFDHFPSLDEIPSLRQLAIFDVELLPVIEKALGPDATTEEREWLDVIRPLIMKASQCARERMAVIEKLARQCCELSDIKYDFLYDDARKLLTVGYNVGERRRDSSYYDILASEARFCSFVGIAQGRMPLESWFSLGRLLTIIGGEPILLSWSGSMFEYLMPLLVMPTYENTLLDRTYKAAVQGQIAYGKQRGVPWGISESGYNAIDVGLNYQYRAFGVPGLGFKRGLADDLVIAPYASALALMVAPEEACLNLQRLAAEGLEGKYGLYEAVDYTPTRLPLELSSIAVRSFMAHHQGMSLLSMAYLLLDHPMQKRFELDPMFKATMLLLQERVPKATAFYAHATEDSESAATPFGAETAVRVFSSPDTPIPEVQLLSNGRYHVMLTNAGGGCSRWKDIAVTRWREDSTCDNWGTFCYIRDINSGNFWSATYQPALKRSKDYEVILSEDRVEFRRQDYDYVTHTDVAVSPEDDIELRRITITNRGKAGREIDVTSYAEVVLASSHADELHPAFCNLFVQTEIIPHQRAILCTRRPRSVSEHSPWMFHLMTVQGPEIAEISYETDRMKFIGRGNTTADPQAMKELSRLSGTQGSVLDPIVAIRYRITLEPEASATINMLTGIGETRNASLNLVEKYQDRRFADRVLDLAWTHSQVFLRQINATETDAKLYGRLAGSVLYANSSLRADPGVIIKNRRGQSALWSYAVSGDFPIVLLRIEDPANIDFARHLVQAHAYWRLKGLTVDLVIWNEDHSGYRQGLHEQIMGLIGAGIEANMTDRPGGIFVRPGDQISNEDRILIQSVARVIISDGRGTLEEQINGCDRASIVIPPLMLTRSRRPELKAVGSLPREDLIFNNGLGGFTPDGREYVITSSRGQVTPAPWSNVLANPNFGTVISESGGAYTWSENAHEFRITPWSNDPVTDSSGEAFYIRDEERGHFWSTTPLPSPGANPYASRHGFGYSVFEHIERGIRSDMWVYVDRDASIKFTVLKVRNESGRSRRLSATGYAELVLGDLRGKSAMHVITEIDPRSGAFFARNRYNTEFDGRVAFFEVDDEKRTVTGNRTEFIGRNGTLRSPAAMTRSRLSGKVGAALDPCAALQVTFEISDGEEREIVFMLGVGQNTDDARNLVHRFRGSDAARRSLEAVWQHWKHTLGAVQVETPDLSLDVMANGWLLYQTLACRLWARSGYYQSGGAFGFRDQLQDVMALIHTRPQLIREHLLLCASRQFPEGDVQHWWHPPIGRGVRTHCSDDYLWLPLATCRYVLTTGDTGVLDESIHFIEGPPVGAGKDSIYDLPSRSEEASSLYEHAGRALLRGLHFGEHGLPLMGSGDWNDGMNLVGEDGKGESVWLGFFLYEALMQFTEVARARGDHSFVERCQREAVQLRLNLERNGWDGEWYRRAYFDDGSPLGSASNPECRIDSIAQSWSVISGAGDLWRCRMAMSALDQRLVSRDHSLIQLLDPPFDKSDLNPGYIKGYVPGVRENGGQYTHAAIWAAMAFARLGDNRRAWELMTMINPVNHGKSPEAIETYKTEPYVMAADVYALAPHIGRGGWSWYTGSAAWMYRLIIETLLGLRLEVDKLYFTPCIPADWPGFKIHYRYRETVYHINVVQTIEDKGGVSVTVDGTEKPGKAIPLVDDRQEHSVEIRINVDPNP